MALQVTNSTTNLVNPSYNSTLVETFKGQLSNLYKISISIFNQLPPFITGDLYHNKEVVHFRGWTPLGHVTTDLYGHLRAVVKYMHLKKSPNLASFYIFGQPFLLLSDPKLIQELLTQHADKLSNKPMEILEAGIGPNLTTANGDEWRNRRQIFNHLLFRENLKEYWPRMEKTIDDHLNHLTPNTSQELIKILTPLVVKIMVGLIDPAGNLEEINKKMERYLALAVKDVFSLANALTFPLWGFSEKAKKTIEEMHSILNESFKEPRFEIHFSKKNELFESKLKQWEEIPNFNEILFIFNPNKEIWQVYYKKNENAEIQVTDLESNSPFSQKLKDIATREKAELSDVEEIKDLYKKNLLYDKDGFLSKIQHLVDESTDKRQGDVALFFTASVDSMLSFLLSLIYFLSANPKSHEKLLNEIDQPPKKKGITITSLDEMEYLKYILAETKRLRPSAIFIPKRVEIPIELKNGVKIPKGVTALWSSYAAGRSQGEDEKFNPERQSGHDKDLKNGFMTFGAGPRICPGRIFADELLKLIIYKIFKKFNVVINNLDSLHAENASSITDGTLKFNTQPLVTLTNRNL